MSNAQQIFPFMQEKHSSQTLRPAISLKVQIFIKRKGCKYNKLKQLLKIQMSILQQLFCSMKKSNIADGSNPSVVHGEVQLW